MAANVLSCLYHYKYIFNRKFESFPPEVFWLILNTIEMKNKLSSGLLGRVLLKNGVGGTEFGTSLIVTLAESNIQYRSVHPHSLVWMDNVRLNEDDIEETYIQQNGNIFEVLTMKYIPIKSVNYFSGLLIKQKMGFLVLK